MMILYGVGLWSTIVPLLTPWWQQHWLACGAC